MIQRFLTGINRFLFFILVATVYAITVVPAIIYIHFILRCTACGKRGSVRLSMLKQKAEQGVKEDTYFFTICRNCGIVKDTHGTCYDVGEDEWALVNSGIHGIQIGDKSDEQPPKRLKNTLRKNKRREF